jgi:hypothetical protein
MSFFGEFHRIPDQVGRYLPHTRGISRDLGRRVGRIADRDFNALPSGLGVIFSASSAIL